MLLVAGGVAPPAVVGDDEQQFGPVPGESGEVFAVDRFVTYRCRSVYLAAVALQPEYPVVPPRSTMKSVKGASSSMKGIISTPITSLALWWTAMPPAESIASALL